MVTRIVGMLLLAAASAVLAQEGSLDPSFNNGGRRLLQVGVSSTQSTFNATMEVQPDGRIVVAQTTTGTGLAPVVVQRLAVDGATSDFATFLGTPGSVSEFARSVALQPDGKILIAVDDSGASGNNFTLYRLDALGNPDPGFGTGGKLLVPISGTSTAFVRPARVLVQPDGRIVVVGTAIADASTSSNTIVVAKRLLANGSPDSGFGTAGQQVIGRFSAVQGLPPREFAYGAKLTTAGKIVIFGATNSRLSAPPVHSIAEIALARLNANGTLDSTFGDGGVVVFDTGLDSSAAYDVALRGDGSFYVLTAAGGTTAIMRFLVDGTLDLGYGGLGLTSVYGAELGQYRSTSALSLALDGSGRVLVGGWLATSSGLYSMIARVLPSGALDSSFGSGTYGPGLFATRADVSGQYYDEQGLTIALQGGKAVLLGRTVYSNVPSPSYYGIVYRLGSDEMFTDGFE